MVYNYLYIVELSFIYRSIIINLITFAENAVFIVRGKTF